jgi:hypothetical protein
MKKYLLLVISLSISFLTFSQRTRKVETKSVQVEEVIQEDKVEEGIRIALKTDVASILLGDIPLLVETKLAYNFSIEAGAFVTYNDNQTRIVPRDNLPTDLNTTPTIGFQTGVRYYTDEVFDAKASYFELNYRYKNLVRTYPESDPVAPGVEIQDKTNRLGIIWGNQWVFINGFLIDIQAGVAYQFGRSTRFVEDIFDQGDGGVIDFEDQFSPATLIVGIRLGYQPRK